MTELLEAGVHFGHQTKRWNPQMKPYIFEKRNAIYIINLGETVRQLRGACEFLASVAARNGKVLFVGCKKQAQEAIREAAQAAGQFYVNQRWLGGTLTNLATIRKSIARMKYIENLEKAPEYSKMGKAEISCLPIFEYSVCFSRFSMYFIRAMLLRMVARFVSVPPSQRWFT